MITDTHTHLYSEQFDEDRDDMIQRAIDAGISRFFIPAIDSSYTNRMLDLEKSHPPAVPITLRFRVKKALESGTIKSVGKVEGEIGRPTLLFERTSN